MLNEFLQGLTFYTIFSLFGIIGFAFLIKISTRSYLNFLIAKPLGLLIFAYPVWLLSSLKVSKFNSNLVLIIFAFAVLYALGYIVYFLKKNEKAKSRILSKSFLWRLLVTEFLSLLLYFGYIYIRGFGSSLESTEKFMDLMFYMSSGKTDYFPFIDPWQAGSAVNYYYYGFYLFALINRLSFVPYSLGYNFSLALIFVSCVTLSFGIVYRISKSKFFSLLGTAFVSVAGNIHYASCVYKNFKTEIVTNCYYPKATRILDPAYTINEMPSYSYILGDMHPHVMGIPFFLTNLYLLFLIYKSGKVKSTLSFVFALSLASSFMINTWDFIVLGLLFACIFFHRVLFKKRFSQFSLATIKERIVSKRSFIFTSFIFALSPVVFFTPFLLHFKSPVEGIGFAPTFISAMRKPGQDFQWPSTPWFLFGLFGGYLIIVLVSLIVILLRKFKSKDLNFALSLFFIGLFCIIFTELFYFRDLFHIANPQYFRANTVFKFGYLAWMLLSLATPIFAFYAWSSLRQIRNIYFGIITDFLFIVIIQIYCVAALIYPFIAIKQAYGPALPWNLSEKTWTIDGNRYIEAREPDDYAAIQWINKNFKERVVIVEAVGNSYTYHARISANTGMINPVNWPTHEWTWRFGYPEGINGWKDTLGQNIETGYSNIALSVEDIKKIYESKDIEETKILLKKYNSQYVLIGNLERTTYTEINEEKFGNIGEVVFESGETRIYKLSF